VAKYSKNDFERIAAAISKDFADVKRHEKAFEAAAMWYRLDRNAVKDKTMAPSKMKQKMTQISDAARKLLKHLEVYDYRKALDGQGDRRLLAFLASAENGTEDEVVWATARIGRLVEVFEAVDATRRRSF
jgi:hypothetical protein